MAKGRMVSQSVATDKRLNELSIEAEYLFLKTIPHLDRDGLITGEAFMLLAKVCPRRQDLIPRMGELIQEWIDAELVLQYETDEGDALYFYGFTKNQTGLRYDREAPSMYAPPPGFERTLCALVVVNNEDEGGQDSDAEEDSLQTESAPILHECGQHPAELRQNSGSVPEVVPPKFKFKSKFKIKPKESDLYHVTEGEPEPPPSFPADAVEQRPQPPEPPYKQPPPVDGLGFKPAHEAPEDVREAKGYGVSAAALTAIVDAVLSVTGKTAAANDPDDRFVLLDARKAAMMFVRNGKRTPEDVQAVKARWDELNCWKWKGGQKPVPPTFRQLKDQLSNDIEAEADEMAKPKRNEFEGIIIPQLELVR